MVRDENVGQRNNPVGATI